MSERGSRRVTANHADVAGARSGSPRSKPCRYHIEFPAPCSDQIREMWRASHCCDGDVDAAGFHLTSAIFRLGSALRHAILASNRDPAASTVKPSSSRVTACVNRASRRYQWNAKRPTNVMTGIVLHLVLLYEWNVWSQFRRKAADVVAAIIQHQFLRQCDRQGRRSISGRRPISRMHSR